MLKLERIVKSFDGINILNNLSLEIPKGQIVSILGPSGSGKTTLLNLILGISEVDSGRIIFENEDFTFSSTATSRAFYAWMNFESPVTSDPAVRKAIAMGIDK